MSSLPNQLADSPEALVVRLAQTGDRDAFADLVRRRQSWIRNLMRRFSGDATLADDLAQQVFLLAWRKISQLRQPDRLGGWLKRLAVTTWLEYLRKNDALRHADELPETGTGPDLSGNSGLAVDLDRALATLSQPERLCIILSYHEGMSHGEIADATDMPPGTIKSHIRRGSTKLKQSLAAYQTDVSSASDTEEMSP